MLGTATDVRVGGLESVPRRLEDLMAALEAALDVTSSLDNKKEYKTRLDNPGLAPGSRLNYNLPVLECIFIVFIAIFITYVFPSYSPIYVIFDK